MLTSVALSVLFLFNNYLTYWRGWPGVLDFGAHNAWPGFAASAEALSGSAIVQGWMQVAIYVAGVAGVAAYVLTSPSRLLAEDAVRLSNFAAFIIRGTFWGVFLIGLADMAISFLRVEDLLAPIVGKSLSTDLGRSVYRGAYVHYPLLAVGFLIASFTRGLGFTWLAVLVVMAEFQIVISRFVFSYEQAFMGDLVRFWYAALFLLGSAYALVEEGHVRVDVLYAQFSERGKAWVNVIGCSMLGLPLCWVILTQGLWSRGASLNSPLLSYEITQTGFGMYVKYLMAGLLIVFALSMTAQFSAYFLRSAGLLRGEPGGKADIPRDAVPGTPAH